MEEFLTLINQMTGAQIWLVIAATVFAICAIMMFVIFWQFNKHRGEIAAAGGESEPEALLIDLSQKTDRERYALTDKPVMIGRIPAHDVERYDSVVIADATVGRRHAVMDFHDDAFWIQDQGSVNGTFVNGRRIESEHRLQDGDEVKIHKFSFQFIDKNHTRQEAGQFAWPESQDTEVKSPNSVLAGHGDTMLDIPKISVQQRENQLRTQVLEKPDLTPHNLTIDKLQVSGDAKADAHISDATVRLVAKNDGDKTTRLYSDLLDGPPINRPDFNQFVQQAAEIEEEHLSAAADKQRNPFKEVNAIPDINEKVIEALDDFFNETADNSADENKLELTQKGDRLAEMGHFATQPNQAMKRVSHGKARKDRDD